MGDRAPAEDALFLIAHPDDELVMSTRIVAERAEGRVPRCIFLTDGRGKGLGRGIREAESRDVLHRLGVGDAQILFLGSDHALPDGRLVLELERAWELLCNAVSDLRIGRIYSAAYEGGHQDHDAVVVLALTLAAERGLIHETWQMPFYTGHGAPWKWFRVMRPVPGSAPPVDRRLPAGEALRHALLALRYPSQWATWIGLFPQYFLARGLLRRERRQPTDPRQVLSRPHDGPLLYEQLQGFSYETFREGLDRFRASQWSEGELAALTP